MQLNGATQNTNESLNNLIWSKCPKRVFVKREVLEIRINSAVIEFNEGANGINKMFDCFKISPGSLLLLGSHRKNKRRFKHTGHTTSEPVKKRRRNFKSIKQGYLEKEKEGR